MCFYLENTCPIFFKVANRRTFIPDGRISTFTLCVGRLSHNWNCSKESSSNNHALTKSFERQRTILFHSSGTKQHSTCGLSLHQCRWNASQQPAQVSRKVIKWENTVFTLSSSWKSQHETVTPNSVAPCSVSGVQLNGRRIEKLRQLILLFLKMALKWIG